MNANQRLVDARRIVAAAAIALVASASSAIAFSLAPLAASRSVGGKDTALGYVTHGEGYYDILDVDGDRTSLRDLLRPPAAPLEAPPTPERGVATPSVSRASRRAPAVTVLRSIEDYRRHVLREPDQLCIVRFSAPWCKVCRTTSVSWERTATKIHKMSARLGDAKGAKRIKFLSVSVDGKDEATAALKDMLQVERVPQGIIHHPAQGLFGQKVDLNRANLTALRKRLETYVGQEGVETGVVFDDGAQSLQ